MLESLLQLDTAVYNFINQSCANVVFDALMPVLSNVKWWLPVYILGFGWMLWKGPAALRWCVLITLFTVGLSDVINSRVVKEMVGRERPSHALANARVLTPDGGGRSFPSTHATNNFAAAFVLSVFLRRYRWLWYTGASAVAFSRVYVGVHYPLDVVGGAIEGTVIAWLLLQVYLYVQQGRVTQS